MWIRSNIYAQIYTEFIAWAWVVEKENLVMKLHIRLYNLCEEKGSDNSDEDGENE